MLAEEFQPTGFVRLLRSAIQEKIAELFVGEMWSHGVSLVAVWRARMAARAR